MRNIHKYTLDFGISTVFLDSTGKFLHFGIQNHQPTIWIEEGADRFPINLHIFPTGEEVPTGLKHLGTTTNGHFVWHLYVENACFS